MQQGVPRTGRSLPGMPIEMDDPDGDDLPRAKWGKNGAQGGRWWWPSSRAGRMFLGLGAVAVIAVFATAAHYLKSYLERDARFRIAGASQIQSVGLSEVTRAELLPVFGEDIGRNVFFVPLNERRKQLEAIPWIQQATVMRLLPDEIRVDVVERKPVAFTRHGQQIGLVDANGVMLNMDPSAMAAHHYSFPVLTGIDAGDKPESRKARIALYLRMMSELDSNGQHNSEQLSEIDLTDPEDARVLMPEQGTDILAHFGEDHFLERYQRYKDHIAEWKQKYPKLAEVDLRYEHQVVLEMASGVSHAQANSGESDAEAESDKKPAASTIAPAKPKPAKKEADKSSHSKSSSVKSSSKKAASTSKSKGSASKSSASKHTITKASVEKKHADSKPAARAEAKTPGRSTAANRTVSRVTTKAKPSPATRATPAGGE
jgi:cell division protein FtsQ